MRQYMDFLLLAHIGNVLYLLAVMCGDRKVLNLASTYARRDSL
jgi:hypothetical protein